MQPDFFPSAKIADVANGHNRYVWDLRGEPAKKFEGMILWGGSTDGPISTAWNVEGWPTLVLIDAKGIIRNRWDGVPPEGPLAMMKRDPSLRGPELFTKHCAGCHSLGTQGTAGRNTVRGPGTQQINMSLSKRFPINRARVEFRAEIFNLLNHNNFGNPDTNISNATVGTITTADDGRNMQLGLRVAW